MDDLQQRANELIAAGKTMYTMGLVPATSGNFSARLTDDTIAITVSGRHKGELTLDDIMRIDMNGKAVDQRRPSAETGLHTQIYQRFSGIGAVLHPHAMSAVLLSRLHADFVRLENYELLKAFPGMTTHATSINVPIFDNSQDIPRLAAQVNTYMDANDNNFGYIIRGHGFYTWGTTVADALRQVEALDYLFNCELRLKEIGR